MRPERGDDGFTLIEILVSLVLLGLMAAMTVNVFQQLKTVRSIQARYEARSNAASVVAFIGSEISRAMVISLRTEEGGTMRPLDGKRNSVRFLAATRSGFKDEALREISVYLETKQGEAKILREIRSRSGDNSSSEGRVDELLKGVTDLKFSYRSDGGNGQWTNNWQEIADLPAAIRIEVADGTSGVLISRTVLLAAGARSRHAVQPP
jgi:type II secretion system protein J